jgi:hypothetical protein
MTSLHAICKANLQSSPRAGLNAQLVTQVTLWFAVSVQVVISHWMAAQNSRQNGYFMVRDHVNPWVGRIHLSPSTLCHELHARQDVRKMRGVRQSHMMYILLHVKWHLKLLLHHMTGTFQLTHTLNAGVWDHLPCPEDHFMLMALL